MMDNLLTFDIQYKQSLVEIESNYDKFANLRSLYTFEHTHLLYLSCTSQPTTKDGLDSHHQFLNRNP